MGTQKAPSLQAVNFGPLLGHSTLAFKACCGAPGEHTLLFYCCYFILILLYFSHIFFSPPLHELTPQEHLNVPAGKHEVFITNSFNLCDHTQQSILQSLSRFITVAIDDDIQPSSFFCCCKLSFSSKMDIQPNMLAKLASISRENGYKVDNVRICVVTEQDCMLYYHLVLFLN